MTLAVTITASAVAILVLSLWIATGGVPGSVKPRAGSKLHSIDIPALRNLLSGEDEKFLQASLSPAHYRRARRARVRALQEYLEWIAENCAILLISLRDSIAQPPPETDRQAEGLVSHAIELRLVSLCLWLLLWIEYALPTIEIRPHRTLRKYEEFWRIAELKLKTRLSPSAVVIGQGLS